MGRYNITTFGCQMNKNDSERISSLLDILGWEKSAKVETADLLILNTCSVRNSAEDRVFGFIENWQKLKAKNPNLIIAVTGCMPGRDKDGKIKKRIKGIDLFFGIDELIMLPQWLEELNPDTNRKHLDNLDNYLDISPQPDSRFQSFVTIQTGCDNFCTYCVVPYARGREKNRKLKDILDEITKLVSNGCKSVTLLGQVVNNYKISDKENISKDNIFKDKDDFATLLWEVNNITGIKRIDFTASDPQHFSDYQIQALTMKNMINYLHLPVQNGDNEILKKMNRKYTVEQYLDLIQRIKKEKEDIAIGTDIIIGFPTETDEQFNNTLDLYKKCQFDISYPAMYSKRSGTAAAKMFVDNVSQADKKKRWEKLHQLMEEIAFENNQKYLNKNISVLVEDCKNRVCSGRSLELKFVQFPGDSSLVGEIVTLKVIQPETWVLRGQLIK